MRFEIPCSYQGVRLANARFESNRADGGSGGALGSQPMRTKNSFYHVTDSTFIGNSAIDKGGAVHLFGANSGARFAGCTFRSNRAR